MEAHLVHKNEDTGELAVVAVLMRLGTNNPLVQVALDAEPTEGGESVPLPRAISLLTLLPPPRLARKGRPFSTYEGSLTTPPCSGHVRWFVFLDSVEVGAQQVVEFMRHGGGGKTLALNARPEQPLNGRQIDYGVA